MNNTHSSRARSTVLPLVLTALFAALTAIGAFLRIPAGTISFTLQVFFTSMAGVLLGPWWGAASQVVYVLLGLIGANMIRESREHDEENLSDSFSFGTMLPLAVATSIDALAVGVTFAFLQVSILPAVCFIGATTFVLSCIGIRVGHVFGLKYKSRAELFGGAVLILMGIKILLEHLGVLG